MSRRALGITAVLAIVAAGLGVAWALGPSALRPLISRAHPEVRWISSAELARALGSGEPPLLIDARSEHEFAVSALAGAQRIDAGAELRDVVPRDRSVVVYCSVGWRSARLAERLRAAGRRDVSNLEGGIFGWANEGRPIWRGPRRVREVHPYGGIWRVWLRPSLHAWRASHERIVIDAITVPRTVPLTFETPIRRR